MMKSAISHARYTGCMSRAHARDFEPMGCAKPQVLISITDPGSPIPELNGNWDDVFVMQAHDTLDEKDWDIHKVSELHDFIRKYRQGSIFAHCEAGISRSAAIREFLERRGWIKYHAISWTRVHPNIALLNMLHRLDWNKPTLIDWKYDRANI